MRLTIGDTYPQEDKYHRNILSRKGSNTNYYKKLGFSL